MANKKKSSQSLKTSTKSRSKNGVMGNQISKTKKSTQSDFGANDEKDTTMCFPWIKVAWLQYILLYKIISQWLRYWKRRLSVSLMLRKQERGRGKQVNATHVKDPWKDTAESKIAQGIWQSSHEFKQFFVPRLQMFICFSLLNLIWLYIYIYIYI